MNRIIESCLRPKYGLYMFTSYPVLRRWLTDNKLELVRCGALINNADNSIHFPNGAVLVLGFGTTNEDIERYAGSEFDFVGGIYHNKLTTRVRPIR